MSQCEFRKGLRRCCQLETGLDESAETSSPEAVGEPRGQGLLVK